jgi:hypothetical protein
MQPDSGKRRRLWTASSPKTGPKWVCKGLVDLSTISHGSTPGLDKSVIVRYTGGINYSWLSQPR